MAEAEAESVPADVGRLDDPAVEQRLGRLDDVLGQLERIPGRTAELALEAVETLTEVYGEALARVVSGVGDRPEVLRAFTTDELLHHLLLLHRVHPDPVELRVARAIADIRPQLRSQGAEVELGDVRDGVAQVSVSSGSCGSCGSTSSLHELVREQVLTVAPELSAVEVVTPAPAPAVIPVAALRRRQGSRPGATVGGSAPDATVGGSGPGATVGGPG